MKTIISKLEDNLFSEILVKKGENNLQDKLVDELLKDKEFKAFVNAGYIKVQQPVKKVTKKVPPVSDGEKPDFASMSYQQLKAYAKAYNITPKSQSKEDILNAIKGE